jgi:hypothetical protein
MEQAFLNEIAPRLSVEAEQRAGRVRRFGIAVSIALIIICNVIVLFGVWASGVNLDELVRSPDYFNAKQDICLRLTWQKVAGASEPMRLCSEWINLSDPSGKTHQLQNDMKVRQGADGRYYVDQGIRADYRLLGVALFVVVVIVMGAVVQRYLVRRYKLHLDAAAGADLIRTVTS